MKYRTGLRRASQSIDPLSSVPRVNIVRSHVRSVSHSVLYAASAFFLLESISALGIIDRAIYGPLSLGADKVTSTLNLLSIFSSLFLFWSGTRKITITRFNRVLPLAAASLILISVLWSVVPSVTLTQGTLYFFIVLGVIGLVEALDSNELMDLMALICGLSAVGSVVQYLIFPEPGDFRGIFAQKNVLGQVMAGGVLVGLHCARAKGGRPFRYIWVIALCTVVAFMSKSATSLLTIFVFFLLNIFGKLYLRGGSAKVISVFLAIACVPIVILFVMNEDLILDLLGKDPTLTGRTLIWSYAIDNISDKPVLGWGFAAFWSPLNPIAWQIVEAIKGDNWLTIWIVNAHNGMLEMLLEIGFVGTSVFIFLWVRNFIIAMKCMNGSAGQFGLSSVILLIGILVVGVSEEVLLSAAQIFTSLFFMMGFICEKELWLARAARRQGVTKGPGRGRWHRRFLPTSTRTVCRSRKRGGSE